MPQPNLVPCRSATSRSAQTRGMAGSASKVADWPLRTNVVGMVDSAGGGPILLKIHGGGIATADQYPHAFLRRRYILARGQCGKGGGTAGFRDDSQHFPQLPLRVQDGIVRYQYGFVDMSLNYRKYQFTDAARRQGFRRDAACLGIDRPARLERACERRCLRWLDGHDLDPAVVPGGESGDEAAASHCDNQS